MTGGNGFKLLEPINVFESVISTKIDDYINPEEIFGDGNKVKSNAPVAESINTGSRNIFNYV